MKPDYEETGTTATMDRPKNRRSNSSEKSGDQSEMMKKVEAAGRPSAGHKALQHFVGDWKAEVKCWSEPGGKPEVSEGTAKATLTMGGLFLQEDFRGEMMGKPFNGRTLMGFDNVKQVFNNVWLCDNQTSMFITEGKGDQDNQVITLEGTASCPIKGDILMKAIYRLQGPDKHTFEMFDQSGGKDQKTLEVHYTRT